MFNKQKCEETIVFPEPFTIEVDVKDKKHKNKSLKIQDGYKIGVFSYTMRKISFVSKDKQEKVREERKEINKAIQILIKRRWKPK